MTVGVGLAAIVGFLVIAELGRALVAKLFGYQAERHAIPIMKLPGSRGSSGFRLALILAGPVTVYLAVAALAFGFFACRGQVQPREEARTIARVMEGFHAAGQVAAGDVILEVEDRAFAGGAARLSEQVNAKGGAPVILTVERRGTKQTLTVTPTRRDDRWVLGVVLEPARDYSVGTAFRNGITHPATRAAAIFEALIALVTGRDEPDAGGPVRIVDEFRTVEVSGADLALQLGMLFGTYTLIGLALFDLVRALLLILFRS